MAFTLTKESKKFLGKGWNFPFKVDGRGGVAKSENEIHIQQSIIQILLISFGERIMRRGFGSGLFELPFEPNDDLLEKRIQIDVVEALDTWEPRIETLDVSVIRDERIPERADILLSYRVIRENVIENMVIPFALTGEKPVVIG